VDLGTSRFCLTRHRNGLVAPRDATRAAAKEANFGNCSAVVGTLGHLQRERPFASIGPKNALGSTSSGSMHSDRAVRGGAFPRTLRGREKYPRSVHPGPVGSD
jgi:hypothetical protein